MFWTNVAITLSSLAVIVSLVSLFLALRPPNEQIDYWEVRERLRGLDGEFTDFADKVTHWMRRYDARRAREGKEPSHTSEPVAPVSAKEYKQALRRKAYGASGES